MENINTVSIEANMNNQNIKLQKIMILFISLL
jgi:hypothetical protein